MGLLASIRSAFGQAIFPMASAAGQFYEGAGAGPRFAGFLSPPVGPNQALIASGSLLTDRSYALERNEPLTWAGINTLCAAMVAEGIMPQPQIVLGDPGNDGDVRRSAALNAELSALWDDWSEEADADGQTDIYGLQALAVRGVLMGGDSFWRLRPRRPEDAAPFMPVPLAVPLQVQLLEAAMCPLDRNEKFPAGGEIKAGIELDALGRRRFYHMYRQHPSDGNLGVDNVTVPVPAESVLHMHEISRAGQLRGEPRLARVILPTHDYHQGEDALQKAWALQAVMSGFIERDPSLLAIEDQDKPSWLKREEEANEQGVVTTTMTVGEWPALHPGEKITAMKPPEVGATYEAAMRIRLRRIACGLGVPYEALAQDYSEITYSSARVNLTQFWKSCDQFIWLTLIPQVLRPLWISFVAAAVEAGKVSISARDFRRDARRYLKVKFVTPKRPWIDPLKDVTGEVLAIEAGLISRDESILSRGGIPEQVDRERQRSKQRAEDLGVTDGKVSTQAQVVAADPAQQDSPPSRQRAA